MKSAQKADKKTKRTEERRGGTRDILSKLIEERTEMLALYCRLAGLKPYDDEHHRTSARDMLQRFCQLLVDYIAACHFGIYERIASGKERRREIAQLAEDLYPRISETTALALDFNDKYDTIDSYELTASFAPDLSSLGEELAARIELEDQLISRMLTWS
jgi:regulator of sigma D